ncbi:hypothetical protein UK82_20595 [Frankia sp. ACN1ag]|nr:hypothetical protein UK82_20595 [Frankia sp. ACN1ag]
MPPPTTPNVVRLTVPGPPDAVTPAAVTPDAGLPDAGLPDAGLPAAVLGAVAPRSSDTLIRRATLHRR